MKESADKYHLIFIILISLTWALPFLGVDFYALGVLFFVIPYLGWKIYKTRNKGKPGHPFINIFRYLNILLMIIVWLAAGLFSYFLPISSWPMSSYQHYAVKKDLLKRGFIPANAKNIFVKDNHGGFHGDGNQFVTFVYEGDAKDIPGVKSINSSIRLYRKDPVAHWTPQMNWEKPALNESCELTIKYVTNDLGVPEKYIPNSESNTLHYYCTDDLKHRGSYCKNLHIYDTTVSRYWYFNITT